MKTCLDLAILWSGIGVFVLLRRWIRGSAARRPASPADLLLISLASVLFALDHVLALSGRPLPGLVQYPDFVGFCLFLWAIELRRKWPVSRLQALRLGLTVVTEFGLALLGLWLFMLLRFPGLV